MTPILRATFLIAFFWIGIQMSGAQELDSLSVDSLNTSPTVDQDSSLSLVTRDSLIVKDTIQEEKVRFKLIKSILDKKYPNPSRAAAMSFILPGSGQVYNKKIWKLPFVYGALGGLGYMTIYNNRQYKRFNEAYLLVVDDDATTLNPFPSLSESTILGLRDQYNKTRQQGYVFFVLAWALNSVDAYVDAHLTSFDVNEDISMNLSPIGIRVNNTSAYGLSMQFTSRSKSKQSLPLNF